MDKNEISLLEGIIQEDGSVLSGDIKVFLPSMGTNMEGYKEVLVDAKDVGGGGWMARQSIKPYIGMHVEFMYNPKTKTGYNFYIPKQKRS